jgi:hypothetical protein
MPSWNKASGRFHALIEMVAAAGVKSLSTKFSPARMAWRFVADAHGIHGKLSSLAS